MKLKKKWKILLITLLSILILAGGTFIGVNIYIDSLLNKMDNKEQITEQDANISSTVQEQTKERNVVNIALFGTDHDWEESDSTQRRADAIKIVSLDMDNKKIVINSIQRDTLVYLPGDVNDFDKINHSYWYGGANLTMQTINMNFDMNITNYVSFSFDSIEKIVDILEGVDLNLSYGELVQVPGTPSQNADGTYHLNGAQAIAYSRIRNLDSDYVRMQRQNNVIVAIMNSAKGKDIFQLLDLVNKVLPYIETNLSNSNIKNYLTNLITFDLNIEQYKIPANDMDDICNSVSYKGFSPLYVLRSYADQAKLLHQHIYQNDSYQPSEQLLEYEEKIHEKFGY